MLEFLATCGTMFNTAVEFLVNDYSKAVQAAKKLLVLYLIQCHMVETGEYVTDFCLFHGLVAIV